MNLRRCVWNRASLRRSIWGFFPSILVFLSCVISLDCTSSAVENPASAPIFFEPVENLTAHDEESAILLVGKLNREKHFLDGILGTSPRERKISKQIRSKTPQLQKRIRKLNTLMSQEWVTSDYVGNERVFSQFQERIPVAVFLPELRINGLYVSGTNVLLINPYHGHLIGIHQGFEAPSDDDILGAIAHEMHHYIAELGGGDSVRWGTTIFEFVFLGDSPENFLEGLTELHAQQFVRKRGCSPDYVAYKHQVIVAYYIQSMVGEEILKQAYFSGDFSQVQEQVERRLGPRVFESVVKADTRIYPESALCLLEKTLEQRGEKTLSVKFLRSKSPFIQEVFSLLLKKSNSQKGRWFEKSGQHSICPQDLKISP